MEKKEFELLYLYKTDLGYIGLYFRCVDSVTESYIQYFDENFNPTRQGFCDEFNNSPYVYKFKRNNLGFIAKSYFPEEIRNFKFQLDIKVDKLKSYEESEWNDEDVKFFTSNGKEYRQCINWQYLPPRFSIKRQ